MKGHCGDKGLNHAVTVVGYGIDPDGTKFWIAKNSYGDKWGDKGYLRIKKDSKYARGVCGIAIAAWYPIMNPTKEDNVKDEL